MRDTTAWRSTLMREMKVARDAYGAPSMQAADLLETELILTLLADYLPDERPELAWAVLNGYPFPARQRLPETTQQAIAITRMQLRTPLGRGTWERRLADYDQLPVPYPIYRIRDGKIVEQPTTLAPERREIMRRAIRTTPPWAIEAPRFAPSGVYRFPIDREPFEVEIPERVAALAGQLIPLTPTTTRERPAISVSLKDLRTTARWMDQVLGDTSGQWEQRMHDIELRCVTATGLADTETLCLDGLRHMIGMVGSGKSSLLTVLAAHLARQGLRVVLVYGDVATLLREMALYERLRAADERITAVPLIGRSTRLTHLNRLHAAEHDRNGPYLGAEHPGFVALSTLCPLDGLRQDVRPIPVGQEPCTTLAEPPRPDGDEEPVRYDCPFMPVCPVHMPTRELMGASIWLATSASLLASSPQRPLIRERMRFIELMMWSADVVLVDEADMVQVQFDDRFAQTEVLIGRADSFLDRLYAQVARQVYRPGRPLVGRSRGFDRWLTAHANAQRAADCLLRMVRDDDLLRTWLRSSYFTGQRLLQRVAYELEHKHGCDPRRLSKMTETFSDNPLGRPGISRPHTNWIEAVRLELLGAESAEARALVKDSLVDLVPDFIRLNKQVQETVATQLLASLVVSILDHALRSIIAGWASAEEVMDLDKGSGGLFFPPSESVTRTVPESPTGAILGFQYYDPQNTGQGELRFFRLRGVGRFLLYHMHDAFGLTDKVAGPHVLLTSGTSWAPGSWRYHVHRPPDYALLPNRKDETARTKCFFTFVPDPNPRGKMLHVSGKSAPQDRINTMIAMVQSLGRRTWIGGEQRSFFDDEFAELDAKRQRILLVVGSYEEAEHVEQALSDILGVEPGDQVVALIPDSDGEVILRRPKGKLRRSNIARLPDMEGVRFLVAPLQAIERGHNILAGQEAAIGSVFFLARPLPVPGDLRITIQKMNTWVMNEAEVRHEASIGEAGEHLRAAADKLWRDITLAAEGQDTYRGMRDRSPLLWTQVVLVWQCIGRLLRGGVPARVHFVDAKWAEVRSGLTPGDHDTEATSMLIGFKRILDEAICDPDPARQAIAQALYGSFAQALTNMTTH